MTCPQQADYSAQLTDSTAVAEGELAAERDLVLVGQSSPPAKVEPLRRRIIRRTCAAAVAIRSGEAGMATAEYAIATLAAAGFAGVLVVLMRSDQVRNWLSAIIKSALSMG